MAFSFRHSDFPDDPAIVEWLEEKVRPFEIAWEQALAGGQRPTIEDYIAPVDDRRRALLLRELLTTDILYRVKAGEQPVPTEYERRFPQHSDLIRDAFRAAGVKPPPAAQEPRDRELEMTCTFVSVGTSAASPVLLSLDSEEVAELREIFRPGVALQDRYVIERELGSGAMGQVYLARDLQLQRPVAIKVIHPRLVELGYDPTRFLQESRIGANLNHHAIATVFDHGVHNEKPFTVFEYLPEATLAELLESRGRLPLDDVRLIIGPLAQALDLIHSRGIIHRDLKPENIRATEHEQFKILDFGLARKYLNQTDWTFCGTRAYASPEQAAQLPCDGRSDQYSLAVIAYELLTGRRPCEHRNKDEFERLHPSCEPKPPREMVPDLPDSVCSAIMQALEKDPNRRFATCEQFAVAMGCHLLSAPGDVTKIIREGDARWMNRFWNRFRPEVNRRMQSIHLALVPEALWCCFRDQILHWPLAAIQSISRRGTKLNLCYHRTNGSVATRSFRFPSDFACDQWYEDLTAAKDALLPPDVQRTAEPFFGTIVVLADRPMFRYQLLGRVEAESERNWRAAQALQIRAAMLGGDALTEVREERLETFSRTLRCLSGTVVRAVDELGRFQLRLRWCVRQVASISLWMISMAVVMLCLQACCVSVQTAVLYQEMQRELDRSRVGGESIDQLILFSAGFLVTLSYGWPLVLALLMGLLRWPQFLRSAGLAFLTVGSGGLLHALGGTIGGVLSGNWPVAASAAVLALDPSNLMIMLIAFLLATRALEIDRSYRKLFTDEERRRSGVRAVISASAFLGSVIYAVISAVVDAWRGYSLASFIAQ